MHHEVKILPVYFQAHLNGDKPFEIRYNADRGFQKGDTITLVECTDGSIATATGRQVKRTITYVTNYDQKREMVVLGLRSPSEDTIAKTLDFLLELAAFRNADCDTCTEEIVKRAAEIVERACALLEEPWD